jgi:phospholipid-binding lipoprotein MlaA
MLALCLGACASLPAGSVRDPRDHAERFNRAMYRFNNALDRAVLRPLAHGYVKGAPAPVRAGISNVLGNVGYTRTIGNDFFQGRIRDFARDIARLTINTTLGVGGLFDPASSLGLERHDRDFGQMLGIWGLHTGSYLVLPLLGPTDVRDAFGRIPDRFMTVDGILNDTALSLSLFGVSALDQRAQLLPLDKVIDSAYDPYAFIRSAWFQHRDYMVHGASDLLPDLPPLDPNGHP